MTGHLVISTIHTEDAVSAIDRLRDMGVEPYLISGGIRGVISQRLLRKVCNNCRETYIPDATMCSIAGIEPQTEATVRAGADTRHFVHGKGCPICFGSGYKGRTGVFEILTFNDEIRTAITHGKDKQELMDIVNRTDFVPMMENACRLIAQGITTVEEVCRTISHTD